MTISRNTFDATKSYKRVRFHEDRDLLDAELNELQEIDRHDGQLLWDRIFTPGSILAGLTGTVNGTDVIFANGIVYLDGHPVSVPGATLSFPDPGEHTIWVDVFRREITAADDPELVNPLTGEPTAEREKWVASLQTRDTSGDPLPEGATGRTVVPIYLFDRDAGTLAPTVEHVISPNDPGTLSGHIGAGGLDQHPAATAVLAGFMSPEDREKLDGIAANATRGQRSATLLVAAVNASDAAKASADYLCDGVDDQVELNAARAALQAVGGGQLVLTEGTFTLSAGVKLCSHLLIAGQGQATLLKAAVPQNLVGAMLATSDSVDPDPHHITLRDLAFDGSRPALPANSNGSFAINLGGVDGGLLENLDVAHCQYAGAAMYLAGCTNVVVRNCRAHDNDGSGIMLHQSCRHCLLEGNVFYCNGLHGISLPLVLDCAVLNNLCWNNGQAADDSYANIYLGNNAAWCNVQGNTCRYHDTAVRPKAGIEIVNATDNLKNLVTNNDLLNGGVTPLLNNDPDTVTAAGNRVGSY